MKFCSLLLICWGLFTAVQAQSLNPGGVKSPIQWYSTATSSAPTTSTAGSTSPVAAASPASTLSPAATPSSTATGLRSQLAQNNDIPVDQGSLAWLNFHPALMVDGLSPLRIPLGATDLHSSSYFTVYLPLDTTKENSIWHIANENQTGLILTTDRMADLSAYQYMNYRPAVRGEPKVNSYVQYKKKDSIPTTNQWWNIGGKPLTPDLPVTPFKGLIPEIIAYDRVLNSRERLQVASYLALKYGITLTEPGATYLNSGGETIWDGYDYSTWHHNIAGICRDDTAGLNQPVAASSNMPGLLTMSTNDSLNNNSFLLWGDNGKSLTPASKIPGLPLLLKKTWLMKPYGNLHTFTTSITLDTRAVDAPLPVNPVYWLVIDPTGEGKFTSPSTTYIKMDKLDDQGKAYFTNVSWDKDRSGKDVWGLIIARELMLVSTLTPPTCAAPRTGSLQTRIIGGQAPYQLTVQNNNGLYLNRHIDDNTAPIDFQELGFGKYLLKVSDAQGHLYTDSFYLNSQDAPTPPAIASSYMLSAGKPLQLDAGTDMPDGLTWQWTGPDNFQSFSPQVTITQPGLYTLSCTKDGCGSQQDVTVTAGHDNILYNVTVFPNPSPAAFNARVTLDNPAPVTMAVYSGDGRLIYTQNGDGRANYQFTGSLISGGPYELIFTSGLSTATKRLLIIK